jgi:Tfp pilus assembly PilM family ATPase
LSLASLIEKLPKLGLGRKTGRFCALDFDREQLRIVHAEFTGERTRILKLASCAIPEDLDITDAQAVGEFIGRTLGEMRIRGSAVVMNVSRGQAILKPLVLPPVSGAGELANMVLYQAEKELTFRPEEAVVDFTIESHYGMEAPSEDTPQGQHVLVAAVQRPIIDYYEKLAKAAEVRLVKLGLRPYADMRCVQAFAAEHAQGRVAIVHILADETEIDVMDSGGLAFSRSAAVTVPPAARTDVAATREAAHAVVVEVARSLHSYMGVERGQAIDAVLLAGGTGIEQQVADDLAKRLAIRCDMLDPSGVLGMEESGPVTSAFISPLGQAAGHGDSTALPYDFLHPKRPPVKRDMGKIAAVGALAAVALVVTGVFAAGAIHWYGVESDYAALTAELSRLTEENRRVSALAKRAETINAWVRLGRDWLDQWAYLTSVFPSCTDTYISSLKTTMANTANPSASISFTVRAKSNEAINELGKRLEAAGYEFKPGQVTTGQDPYGYVYSTNITVMVKPDMKVELKSVAAAPRPEDDAAASLFGKPRPAAPPPVPATATGRQTATAPSGTAPGGAASGATSASAETGAVSPLAEWQARWAKHQAARPPQEGPELTAWKAKRSELQAEVEAIRKQQAAAAAAAQPPATPPAPEGRKRRGVERSSNE